MITIPINANHRASHGPDPGSLATTLALRVCSAGREVGFGEALGSELGRRLADVTEAAFVLPGATLVLTMPAFALSVTD
jgi:hypothetical protein